MNKNLIYLAQTDTTVGFLSADNKKLAKIKNRSNSQKILRVVDSFKTLKTYIRIPKTKRKKIRNSKNTTFIYPNGESFRVVSKNSNHIRFIKKFQTLYSTSANETGNFFDENFAIKQANIELITSQEYCENSASCIIKLNKLKSLKLR